MATYEQLMDAARRADAAGDAPAAKRFLQLARQAQQGQQAPEREALMPQLNRGIAQGVGGLVDLLNPFDTPDVARAFGGNFSTGSARDGLTRAMEAGGVNVADRPAETTLGAMAEGAGQAAAALIPATGVARGLSAAGGMVGNIADDAYRAMASRMGIAGEMAAGAGAGGAQQAAEAAGASEGVQALAGMAGGVTGGLLALHAPRYAPSAMAARGVRSVAREVAPFTEAGGREMARQHVQALAGGPERSAEIARSIGGDNLLGLTPAQQTADPGLLALEQRAGRDDPALGARLRDRAAQSNEAARGLLSEGSGDVEQARSFIDARRREAFRNLNSRVEEARRRAEAAMPRAQRPDMENSEVVAREVRQAEAEAVKDEKSLWAAVPRGAQAPTARTREVAARLIAETPQAQQNDIPQVVRRLLGEDGSFGDIETVNELHGLYSELRRLSRTAMAGNDQNKNMARISNEIAEAILDDLGAVDASTDIGRAINEARSFSAALHETFDRGAVGRLLKRTLDGDEQIDPALTLDATIRPGGSRAAVADRDIQDAVDFVGSAQNTRARDAIADYMRGQFASRAVSRDGSYSPRAANTYAQSNQALLQRYPEVARDLERAISARDRAARTETRAGQLRGALEDPQQSAGARFLSGPPERTVQTILAARSPSTAARSIVRQAAKDETGRALAGVKGAFSDYVIDRAMSPDAMLSGQKVMDLMQDRGFMSAAGQVYSPAELNRLRAIGAELSKLNTSQRSVQNPAAMSDREPNNLVSIAGRVIGARAGAQMSGGGAGPSLQAAQLGASRVQKLLGRLTNDRAQQMLRDAVEDPELMRLLLTDEGKLNLTPEVRSRLAPYFVGAAAGAQEGE